MLDGPRLHIQLEQQPSKLMASTLRRLPVAACYNIGDHARRVALVELKVRRVGNSVGVVLPKAAIARVEAREGDSLWPTEASGGGWRLAAGDPGFVEKMRRAEDVFHRYRDSLAVLAR